MTTTNAQTPAYVSLATTISTELRALGIEPVSQKKTIDGFQGNEGWVCWQHPKTEQKIYLSRTKAGKGIIHTTLNVDPSTPGYLPYKPNGKIAAHFEADAEKVIAHLLPLFAGTQDKLRASRTPVRGASQAASSPEPQVTLHSLTGLEA